MGIVNKILYTSTSVYPTSYTGDTKFPTMYMGEGGTPTPPPPVTTDKLLMESGFYLLLETGDKILL